MKRTYKVIEKETGRVMLSNLRYSKKEVEDFAKRASVADKKHYIVVAE